MAVNIPRLDQDVTNAREFLSNIDSVLFDCDGVLWNGKGILNGAVDVVRKLKSQGKNVVFVTNNSGKSRKDYLRNMTQNGFDVKENEIYCTSIVAALYLKNKLKCFKKAYVIGRDSIVAELANVGIASFGPGPLPMKCEKGSSVWETIDSSIDPEVGTVIVGFDEHISFQKIHTALQYLRKPGVNFIATNTDAFFPIGNDLFGPGTGSIVAAVKTCATREPIVVGKPETHMFEVIQTEHDIDPTRTLMVGDRLETDILFGKNSGLKTLLVLTGVSGQKELDSLSTGASPDLAPDYYMQEVGNFLKFL